MERITEETNIIIVGDKQYNLNEARAIMQDKLKREAYVGPSKIDYLAQELGINFEDALEVLDALITRDDLKRVNNRISILQIAGEIAERIK